MVMATLGLTEGTGRYSLSLLRSVLATDSSLAKVGQFSLKDGKYYSLLEWGEVLEARCVL